MFSQALRGINLRLIMRILLIGVMIFSVVSVFFMPTEVLAEESGVVPCNPANIGGCMVRGATSIVNVLVGFVAWILYWAGMLFELTLHFSIYTDYNDLEAVKSGWILFRDLINILFIFILLYIAFGTVLKIEKVNWKKQLAAIVIAAILVNFSLFITRVAIDASNIVALGIHSQLTTCEGAHCTGQRMGPDGVVRTITITEAIINSLGLPKTFGETAFGSDVTEPTALRNGLIRLGVISLITWAFISVALLFIARSIVFVFLLVTSPIGIAGASLPMLQKPAKEWRENLFNQALVAPVFLLMMYIILRMSSDILSIDNDTAANLFSSKESSFPDMDSSGGLDSKFWLNFILLLGFIIAAVRITKDFSGKAGAAINGLAGKAVAATAGVALGAATLGAGLAAGGAAMAGRQVAGRASAAMLNSRVGTNLKKSAEGGNRVARFGQNVLRTGAGSSYDIRQTSLGAFGIQQVSSRSKNLGRNLSVGAKAGEGGRLKAIERGAEKDVERLKDMSSEGLRKWADMKEREGQRGLAVWARGKNEEAAKKLRRLADSKETSKEEREKRVSKAADDLRKTKGNEEETKKVLSGLKSRELSQLPSDVFKDNPWLIRQLQIGDVRALQGNVDRETMEAIVKSDELNDRVKNWIDDPKNGFPDSGRPATSAVNEDTFANMSRADYAEMRRDENTELAAEIGAVMQNVFRNSNLSGEKGGTAAEQGVSRGSSYYTGLNNQPIVGRTGNPIPRPNASGEQQGTNTRFGGQTAAQPEQKPRDKKGDRE